MSVERDLLVDGFVTSMEYNYSFTDNRSGEITVSSAKDKQRLRPAFILSNHHSPVFGGVEDSDGKCGVLEGFCGEGDQQGISFAKPRENNSTAVMPRSVLLVGRMLCRGSIYPVWL